MAAVAGVSRSTVSYILNGSHHQTFAPETEAKVRAAAAGLSYTPHAAARALRKGASGIVLLALQDLPPGGNLAKLISALTDGVRATDRSLVTLALRPGNRLTDALRDISPQALLEVLSLPAEDTAAAAAASIPVLSVAAPLDGLDRAAGRLQVEHLAALGHRRLGVVTPGESFVQAFSCARLEAVAQAATDLSLPAPEVGVVDGVSSESIEAVAALLRRWTSAPDPITAVCGFNDVFAGMVVAAAARAGLTVPGDLSVVGIDDEPLGAMLNPTLTTVRYDFTETGVHTRDQLHHLLDDGAPAAPIGSDSLRVIQRDSTRPPSRTSRLRS
ncbi:MAG: LacI family transcriptional regulator [Cellulomonadaceae bacterium]|nr:LacI family transcriptional regulator [Cellulomonadaceae bacterium]